MTAREKCIFYFCDDALVKKMEKIGILTCLHSNDVCARVGCLSSFWRRKDFFAKYAENTILAAMLTCNGCKGDNPSEPEEDKGILEKLDRLVSEEVKTVHVGVCRLIEDKKECPRMTKICEMIESREIQVIRGTHRE